MRAPLRSKATVRQKVTSTRSYVAPVGGWNARDALASMKPEDAVALDNFFPRPSYVEFRGGYSSHATGMTGSGKTLATYNALTGTNKLFCYTASGIYDVSSAGAVGASKLSRTNGKHQWTMFGDGTSNWLIACNGVDKPAYFDGTTWTAVDGATTPALTGVTTTDIISAHVFKGRLIFLFKESLKFGYLTAGLAGGAVSTFDLSGEASKGGYLISFATWTRDGGSGVDDFAVFFTSEGEAIVYQGTNPNSATTWAKVGSYSIGRPLGRRCTAQYGADCVVITENGVFPLSALLQSGDAERSKFALSFKIQNAFTEAARLYDTNFGWKVQVYPAQDALLVNVPITEGGEHEQYVMNTITKAWCRFKEWDAEDFGILNGELYMTSGTAVYKAWTGNADNGSNIVFYGKQAFQDFGDPNPKQCKMFMPLLSVNGSLSYGADVDVDFDDDDITGTVSYTVANAAIWDTSTWDNAFWASGMDMVKQWSSPAEWTGRWLSGKIKITSNALTVQWVGSTMIYEDAPSL